MGFNLGFKGLILDILFFVFAGNSSGACADSVALAGV